MAPPAAFVIQASVTPRPTCVVEDFDAVHLPCFPAGVREALERCAFDVGGVRTCEVPGRVVVPVGRYVPGEGRLTEAGAVCLLGDAMHCDPQSMRSRLGFVREHGPTGMADFLQVCADNGLCLNKYLLRAR